MSQVVSKQSLSALANLAFQTLRCEGDKPTPEHNLDDGVGAALFGLVSTENAGQVETDLAFDNGFTQGVELGLAVAGCDPHAWSRPYSASRGGTLGTISG